MVLPYHLSAADAARGHDRARASTPRCDDRVAALVAEREPPRSRRSAGSPGLTVFPSGANFLLVRVDGDGHALWQRLVERGVLVRDFSRWPRLEDCLRVTVGTPDENDAFLAALREPSRRSSRA